MKVLLLAPIPPPVGGVATWTETVLSAVTARRDLEVLHLNTSTGSTFGISKRGLGPLRGGAHLGTVLGQCAVALRRFRPDLIHIATSGGSGHLRDLSVLRLARQFSVPVVIHLHHGYAPTLLQQQDAQWPRLLSTTRRSASVIVLDAASAAVLSEQPGMPAVHHIINPVRIEPSMVTGAGRRRQQVIYVGQVRRHKGILNLLTAWRRAAEAGWRLVLVGGVAEDLEDAVRAEESAGGVIALGQLSRSQTLSMIAASEVLTLASPGEGCPNAVLEAMLLGTPVVATSVGALPELLSDDRGLLVPSDDASALATGLRHAMGDAVWRATAAARSREWALANAGADHILDCYMNVWRSVADRS